jgi:predicted Zn-ribbon and HTH transcriptional regulator
MRIFSEGSTRPSLTGKLTKMGAEWLARKLTYEDVKEFYKAQGCELLEDNYLNNSAVMGFLCHCGEIGKSCFKYFKKVKQCRKCGFEETGAKLRKSYEQVKKEFEDGGCVLLESEYKNARTKMKYECECGNTSKITFSLFKRGSRCADCKSRKIGDRVRKYRIEDIKLEFELEGLKLLALTYKNNLTPMSYVCNCGKCSKITYAHFLKGGRCRDCGFKKSSIKQSHSNEHVAEIARNAGFILLEEYTNSHTPLRCKCRTCGHISEKVSYTFKTNGCMNCHRENNVGENHPSWKPDLTDEDRVARRLFTENNLWREAVLKRDNYTCKCCGQYGGSLVAHHLDGYNWCKEKRTDVENGVVLCRPCHDIKYEGSFHNVYGNGNNTREQFDEWLLNKQRKQDAM